MAGGNLRESLNTLRDETGLALESFVQIGLQITKGIEYLHAEGLAHRDIKSANILLTDKLAKGSTRFSDRVRAKIADFGLSKYIDKATGGGTVMQSIMEPGRLEATYAYLAPEAFGGDKSNAVQRNDDSDDDDGRYDEMAKKRDIYALGVLFWEMLTGQIPWAGVSLPDVYVRVCVRSDRPGPALDDAKVSKSVRRLVERCWAQNPTRRPSAKSIAAKLEKIAMKIGVAADPTAAVTAKSKKASAAAAAVEAVSMVSGQAPNPVRAIGVNHLPDLHSEPLKDLPDDQRDLPHGHTPSDSLMSYQKMPSASTVYTTHTKGSKTQSTTGFEASEARDTDRGVEDIPGHFDDDMWIDDGESHGNTNGKHPAVVARMTHAATNAHHNTSASHAANANNSVTPARSFGHKGSQNAGNVTTENAETGPSSLNRRQVRPRHHTESPDVATGRAHPVASSSGLAQSQSLNHNASGKSNANATAVAATAAAIAAAKDRERKRDDLRGNRGPTTRVTRPQTPAVVHTNAVGDTSFQSLPSAGDGWQRGIVKERAMFYDNSDEEAQDFDPERAAAEEALADSNTQITAVQSSSTRHMPVAGRPPPQTQRSSSMNRGTPRPKSPVVRRPMSPAVGRHLNSGGTHGRNVTEEDTSSKVMSSKRTSDATPPKRNSGITSRRLGRTMSASTPTNAQGNRATPIISSASGVTQPTTGPSESSGKRAFIRRMRSTESNRRMARSSSTTGVESKRASVHAQVHKTPPSHASDNVASEEEDGDYTVMQIGAAPREDYRATVGALDKARLIRLFSQKMVPLRLAALAHASLISPKHRNEEELLRNSCAILHRLTVPGNSSQSKNSVQEISPKEQLSIRKYLKSNQGVEALLQAMHPPRNRHPTTLSYALLALGNLTAWDLEAHKQFRNSHGVVQVTQVMRSHIGNAGVQEKGCYALACVGAAYPAKSKNVFEQAGALDVVIEALSDVQRESPNDAVTKQACAALGAMCSSSPPNALFAGRKEALTYLVTAFERFRRHSRVDGGKRSEMRLVCKAFIDLLCHAENRKLAGSKGGSTMIIRAMRIFRLDADFIEKGLSTLAEFCAYRANGAQIVQASGVDDIVAAMERFRMSENMQKEGCKVLTLLMKATGDQARRRLVHAGGAEAIVLALERFGAIPEVNVAIVVETCRAMHTLFLMENPAEGEILGRRMKKIKCDKAIKAAMVAHRGNQSVQDKGRETLKQLGSLKSGGGLWGRMRSGQKKR